MTTEQAIYVLLAIGWGVVVWGYATDDDEYDDDE